MKGYIMTLPPPKLHLEEIINLNIIKVTKNT